MRTWLIGLAVLILSAGCSLAQQSEELLKNPGFDIDADGDGLPDGWNASESAIKRQETVYLSGNYEIGSKPGAYVLATQPLTLQPGKHYTIRITGRGTEDSLLGALLLHGPQRPVREFPILWNVQPSAKHEEYTGTFVAPNPVCSLYLYNVSRKGGVFYDSVSLREGLPDQLLITQLSLPKIDRPLSEPLVTRHIPYAQPLAGGPLKAFITQRTLRSRREALELAQRLDLDYDMLGTGYLGDEAVSETGRRAMQRMKDSYYELYVVNSRLTPAAAKQIAEKVQAGAGLVVIEGFGRISSFLDAKTLTEATPEHALRQGVPWDHMPEKILSSVQYGQLGKGRVVRLNFPSETSRVWGMLPLETSREAWNARQFEYWEWWYSALARAMAWAARGETPVKLTPGPGEAGRLAVQVAGAPEGAKATVVYRSSRELRFDAPGSAGILSAQKVSMPLNKGVLQLTAPKSLPAGTVFAEVMLQDAQGQTLNWGSYALQTPQAVKISEMGLDKETYRANETVKVTLKLQPQSACSARVEARLIDAFGRVIASNDLSRKYSARPQQEALTLKLSQPLCVQHKLFVRVLVEGSEQDSRWLPVRVPEMGPKLAAQDFVATTWGAGMLHPAVMEYLGELTKDLGLNSEFAIDQRFAGEHGMLAAGYSGGGGAFREEAHSKDIRQQCLSDPKVVQAFCDKARESAALQQAEGGYAVGITDEAFLSYHNQRQEVCFCPLCQSRFQKWLQERYPSLEALNAEWGTSYTSWEQVKGTKTEEIRGKENFAPFVDFRTFMTDQWITACRQITDAYHEVAPQTPMGHTNTFGVNPFNGNDYWKLCTQTGFGWGQEYSEAIKASGNKAIFELWRSFVDTPEAKASRKSGPDAPPTKATAATPFFNYGWIGYDRKSEAARYEPWWLALHGSRGVSYYATVSMDEAKGRSWCLIYPTLSYTPYSQAVKETLPDLREGCGKLLMDYKREQPKVAILWSHPSMLTAWCESTSDEAGEPNEREGTDAYGLWNVEALNFRQHLNELQLDYQYVAPEQILKGDVLKQHPLLILPVTVALEAALVEKLEAYLQAGGVVVGDIRCLRTDEHGRPDAAGALERIFGVRRLGKFDYGKTLVTVKESGEKLDLRGKAIDLYAREALQPTGATPLAAHATGEPALLVMNHSKGASLYLNFALPKYDVTIRELMKQIVARAGISREVTVENDKADAPPRCWERNTFTRGPLSVHAFIRDHRRCQDSDPVTIDFGGRSHVYDMRARKYVGQVTATQAVVAPGGTALYACLPYKVIDLQVKTPARVKAGQPLSLTALVQAAGKHGDHVLHVELIDPQGQSPLPYRSNQLAPGGKLDLTVPLALNDQPGTWTVKVRDVLTGTTSETKLKVD
ncbi:MAG: beta-galactosidase [Armatimonadota bacterium]